MISTKAQEEFLAEAADIVEQMSASCDAAETPDGFKAALTTLERGLHTLYGNAATFGYGDFAEAAQYVLQQLRASKNSQSQQFEKPIQANLVRAFINLSRDYLKVGGAKKKDHFQLEMDERRDWAEAPTQEVPRDTAPTLPEPGRASRLLRVKEILEKAPVAKPRIEALVNLAMHELKGAAPVRADDNDVSATLDFASLAEALARTPTPAPATMPKPAPAVAAPPSATLPSSSPGATTVASQPAAPPAQASLGGARASTPQAPAPSLPISRSAAEPTPPEAPAPARTWPQAHAYALEGLYTVRLYEASPPPRDGDRRVWDSLIELRWLLGHLYHGSVNSRITPIGDYVQKSIDWARGVAAPTGLRLDLNVPSVNINVLPGVGLMVQRILKEVFLSLLVSSIEKVPGVSVSLSLESSPGHLEMKIGLRPELLGKVVGSRLRLLESRLLLFGVTIAASERCADVAVRIPGHLDSLDVLLVASGENCVGIPMHRVGVVHQDVTTSFCLRGDSHWIQIADKKYEALRPEGNGALVPADGPLVANCRNAVVLDRAAREQAVIVDRVLSTEELVATITPPPNAGRENTPFWSTLLGLELIPLVWLPSH